MCSLVCKAMENMNVCRLCVGYKNLILIGDKYSNIVRKRSYSNISDKIMYSLDIEVLTNEKICLDCISWLNKYCSFKAKALSADKFLQKNVNDFTSFADAKQINSLFNFPDVDAEILNYKKKKENVVGDNPVILIADEDTSEDDSIEIPPFSHLCPDNEDLIAIDQPEEQLTATNTIQNNEQSDEARNCCRCEKLLQNEIFWKSNASYCKVCKDIKTNKLLLKTTCTKKVHQKLKRKNHTKCFNLKCSVHLIKVDDPKSIKFDLRKFKGIFKQDVLQSRKYIFNLNKKIKNMNTRKCVTLQEWNEFEKLVALKSNNVENNILEQPENTLRATDSTAPQPETSTKSNIELLQVDYNEPDPKIGQQSEKIITKAQGKPNTQILYDNVIRNETSLKLIENEQSFGKLNHNSDISSPDNRNQPNSATVAFGMNKSLGNISEEIPKIPNIEREIASACNVHSNDPGVNILTSNEFTNTKTQSEVSFPFEEQLKDGEYAMQTDTTNLTNFSDFSDMPPLVPIVVNNHLTERNLLNKSQSNCSRSVVVRFPKYDAVFRKVSNLNVKTPPVVDPTLKNMQSESEYRPLLLQENERSKSNPDMRSPISNNFLPQDHAVKDFNVNIFGMHPFQTQLNDGNIKSQVISTGGNILKSPCFPLDNTASLNRTLLSSDIPANTSGSSNGCRNVLMANNEPVADAIPNQKEGFLQNNGAVNVKYLEGVQVMPVVYRDNNVNTTVYIVKPEEIQKTAGKRLNLKRSADSSKLGAVRRASTIPATYHKIKNISSDNMKITRVPIKY